MSLKSRSVIYDRLEKLLYDFSAVQDDDETGLTGKESIEIIGQRFAKWLVNQAPLSEENPAGPRNGKVFSKDS